MEVNFQGDLVDPLIDKMIKVLYKDFIPTKAVLFVADNGPAQAMVCLRGACQAPAVSLEAFERIIRT